MNVSETKINRLARTKWSKMSEEVKQFYRSQAKESVQKSIEEPEGISLPKTAKRLMKHDPNLPQGWGRKLLINSLGGISLCVITADKVRLYSTEGVRRYLANHHITDIEPESISFSPYRWETDCDQTSSSREVSGGSVEDTDDPLAMEGIEAVEGLEREEDFKIKNEMYEPIPYIYSVTQRNFCALRYRAYKNCIKFPIKKVQKDFKLEYPEFSRVPSNRSILYWAQKLETNGTLDNLYDSMKGNSTQPSSNTLSREEVSTNVAQDPLAPEVMEKIDDLESHDDVEELSSGRRKAETESDQKEVAELFSSFSSVEEIYENIETG